MDTENHVCVYDINTEIKMTMVQTGATEEEMGKQEDRSMRANELNVLFMYAHR